MTTYWMRFLPGFLRDRLVGRVSLQKGLENTVWIVGDQLVQKIAGLLIGILVARHFGPKLFGELSYAIAIYVIASPLARLSLEDIAIRKLVRQPTRRNEVLGTSLILMLIGGVSAFLLALGLIFFIRPESPLIHWLVGILTASYIFQAFMAIEFWFEAQMQWKFNVYAKTSVFLLVSLAKVILLLANAPLVAFAWAGLVEAVFGAVGLILVFHWQGYAVKALQFSRDLARRLLQDSWPLILAALLTMVYLRIDQVMIGNMLGSVELGYYSVAVQISEVWIFIPMAVVSAVYPAFVEVERDNEALFYAHLQRFYALIILYAYFIAIPVSFFADEIVTFLFSETYLEAGRLVKVLVWAMVFTSLGTVRNILILAKNWTRINLLSVALGGMLNVFLNLYLIPIYGAMGAVVATLLSYWFAVHGSSFIFRALRKNGWMMTRAIFYPKVW